MAEKALAGRWIVFRADIEAFRPLEFKLGILLILLQGLIHIWIKKFIPVKRGSYLFINRNDLVGQACRACLIFGTSLFMNAVALYLYSRVKIPRRASTIIRCCEESKIMMDRLFRRVILRDHQERRKTISPSTPYKRLNYSNPSLSLILSRIERRIILGNTTPPSGIYMKVVPYSKKVHHL